MTKVFSAATTESHPEYAEALHRLAWILIRRRSFQEAENVSREAVRIRQIHLPARDRRIADSLNDLGEALRSQERYADAESFYIQALDILASTKKPDMLRASVLSNLGLLHKNAGRFGEAQRRYHEAIEIMRAAKPGSADLGISVQNLASLYEDMGDTVSAERLYLEAGDILQKADGPPDVDLSLIANNLGDHYRVTHRYAEAEVQLHRAVDIRRPQLQSRSPVC